ncbi:hypothetical protein RJ641_013262 [Dillenia turbinata]|uniref:Uncharacterized protein n=1 Tax=Dillenia turbinata TaxID=194707 RepID=A0AAN8WFL1_9MAGN
MDEEDKMTVGELGPLDKLQVVYMYVKHNAHTVDFSSRCVLSANRRLSLNKLCECCREEPATNAHFTISVCHRIGHEYQMSALSIMVSIMICSKYFSCLAEQTNHWVKKLQIKSVYEISSDGSCMTMKISLEDSNPPSWSVIMSFKLLLKPYVQTFVYSYKHKSQTGQFISSRTKSWIPGCRGVKSHVDQRKKKSSCPRWPTPFRTLCKACKQMHHKKLDIVLRELPTTNFN